MNIQRHVNSRKHFCAYWRTVTLLLAIVLASTAATHAELYGFRQMNNGTPVDKVTVNVTEEGVNPENACVRVHFTLRNVDDSDATIVSDVWIDDRCMPDVALVTFDSIINGPGVNFTLGANPNNPPTAE